MSTTPLDKAKLLPAKLSGPAFSYWQTLSPEIQNDYTSVKASLTAVFNRLPFIATFQTYLNARPRKPQEPLAVYAAELTTLVSEAFPTYDAQAKSSEVFRRFVTGLDSSLQLKIHEHGALTLEAALKVATQCERGQLALTIASPSSVMPVTVGHTTTSSPLMPITELTAAIAELRADFKALQHAQAKTSEDRLDQLSRQFTSLRQEVSGILQPHACATTDYTLHHVNRNQQCSSDCCATSNTSSRQPFSHDDRAVPHRRHSPGQWQARSASHQPPCCDGACFHRRGPSPAYIRESAHGHPHLTDHYTSTRSYYTDFPSRSPSRERRSRPTEHTSHASPATYSRSARSPSPSPHHHQATYVQRQHRSPTRHVHFSKDTSDQGNY